MIPYSFSCFSKNSAIAWRISIETFVPGVSFFANAARRFKSFTSSQILSRLSMMTMYTSCAFVSREKCDFPKVFCAITQESRTNRKDNANGLSPRDREFPPVYFFLNVSSVEIKLLPLHMACQTACRAGGRTGGKPPVEGLAGPCPPWQSSLSTSPACRRRGAASIR